MAEKHVHKVYGSFPPWGKSVEFPAGGSGSGGGVTYIDVSTVEYNSIVDMLDLVSVYKCYDDEDGMVITLTGMGMASSRLIAIGIILNQRFSTLTPTQLSTVEQALKEFHPFVLDLPRITEEEFYNINSNESPE